jgi:hypothetical protein
MIRNSLLLLLLLSCTSSIAQSVFPQPALTTVAPGWAKNSINTVVFRRNSLVTHKNYQYIAFYDSSGKVVLGKRKLNAADWTLRVTPYSGNVNDAHNSISLMVDGDGYLHLSWDHHNNALRYCKSIAPGSLEVTEKLAMTGLKEKKVTYPEFYRIPNGDLFFLYRDGSSGNGNLMLNYYNTAQKKWTQLQDGWINGEGERNAYWQMTTDSKGTLHVSWVWRETADVATNHDMCYARSRDGGKTWEKSTGERYVLPITAKNAEYAHQIPQKSELINSTSMAVDDQGNPYIVSYWREKESTIPQYHLIANRNGKWQVSQISDRKTPFSLSGGGTKAIPISRPHIVVEQKNNVTRAIVVYRDVERGSKISVATTTNIASKTWQTFDLTTTAVDAWEPSYDTELWAKKRVLSLFVQKTSQGDGEKTKEVQPEEISVLDWKPKYERNLR